MTGGVTFCALVPMRSIPFRVVAVLGLNDSEFPRSEHPVDFDLARGALRRLGDRTLRDDDRYLFLEALLSAREHLLLSYRGQSARDQAEIAPSVVLEDLLAFEQEQLGEAGAKRLVIHHPLQAFSPRYFDGTNDELFSYDASQYEGALGLTPERSEAPLLFSAPLEPARLGDTLELTQLMRFLENPTRYLLNQRLGINLSERAHDVPEREPLELDGLENYKLGSRMVELLLLDKSLQEVVELVNASGVVPDGSLGTLRLEPLLRDARSIVKNVAPIRDAARARLQPVRIPLGSRTVVGALQHLHGDTQLFYYFAARKAKYLVHAWLAHLAACHHHPNTETVIVARSSGAASVERLMPVTDPSAHLEKLLSWYERGLERPLPFFPGPTEAWLTEVSKSGDENKAWSQANSAFRQELNFEPHWQRVFGTRLSLEQLASSNAELHAHFIAMAEDVFTPLLKHKEPVT
jgi:exodeoxyribonuclease V gamma subunit